MPLEIAKQKPAESNRLVALDAIRGVAVLLVMLEHVPIFWPAFQTFVDVQLDVGRAGVVAFFIISGFVIPMSLDRQSNLTTFWIHRAFRILPMYWISVVACTAVLFCFPNVAHSNPYFNDLPKSFFWNLTMLEDAVNVPRAMGLYATLTFELFFYAMASLFAWIKFQKAAEVILGLFIAFNLVEALGIVHMPTHSYTFPSSQARFSWERYFTNTGSANSL